MSENKCKNCGGEAAFSTLSNMYTNSMFCEICYESFVEPMIGSYLMVVDLRKGKMLNTRVQEDAPVEVIKPPMQHPAVMEIRDELKKFLGR